MLIQLDSSQKTLNSKTTVVVGMSGGVDSSVSALILKEQGYNVIGMFMKNWEEKDENGICQSTKDYEDVINVCEKINIPYYSINFVKEYWDQVFTHFIEEFKQGHTPNPDILCNREIKFKVFLERAMAFGADYLATGHYCQNEIVEGEHSLIKGADASKDQSYFLYTLKKNTLKKVLFPIGHMPKKQVRALAQHYGLSTFEKKDSTGICFIGERNFKQFLSQYIAIQSGNFETLAGQIVGKHDGVAYYTIGQRKGLGIGGPGDAWFVVGKDIKRNVVYIEQGSMHPAMYSDDLTASDLSWISEIQPTNLPFKCKSKIRYRQEDQDCTIMRIEDGKAFVTFDTPQRAITPRQSIVFYRDEVCLGGGIIDKAGPSLYDKKLLNLLHN